MTDLIPWQTARDRVLDAVGPLPAIELAVAEAHGHALAADVIAPEAMPPFDNSAMDGFAVRAATSRHGFGV